MILTLAFRHLWVRKLRSLFLLIGFALGVGVMIVLLSVGEAMLVQSRDVALVGGGEVTVLPAGIDLDAMRTGGVNGMFFSIDRARFVERQLLGGPRNAGFVTAVAPDITNQLLYLDAGSGAAAVRAEGRIPSRDSAVGAALPVVKGSWHDTPADSAWFAPTAQQLYDQLDHFHMPRRPDSTWGEWHYFNLVSGPGEWWYLTLLIGGEIPDGRWGGQIMMTHRRPDGRYEHFTVNVPADSIRFDTTRADLTVGQSSVMQRDGIYHLRIRAAGADLALQVTPLPHRYFPPVELSEDVFRSGYAVPGLVARASGRICVRGGCTEVHDVPAYHDHNWGTWHDVTWEWGMGQGTRYALLYGGVYQSGERPGQSGAGPRAPFFVAVVDSLGLVQVLRFRNIDYQGALPVAAAGVKAPSHFSLIADREGDTLRIDVQVQDARATATGTSGVSRHFIQMRGRFQLEGHIAGRAVADSGEGFFETYLSR